MKHDILIRHGHIIDGSGNKRFAGDIGITGDRISAIGDLSADTAAEVIDATDLIVAPGFIDPHTHYDAQLYWDPMAAPSSWHGVTSVIGGNCGFTLAPAKREDVPWLAAMLSRVAFVSRALANARSPEDVAAKRGKSLDAILG